MGELVQIAAHTDPDGLDAPADVPGRTRRRGRGQPRRAHRDADPRPDRRRSCRRSGPGRRRSRTFCGRPITLVRCERPGGTRRAIRPASCPTARSASSLASAALERCGRAALPDAHRARGRRAARGGHLDRPPGRDRWRRSLAVTKPDARCAITTQDPDTGVRDLDTLRMIIALPRPARRQARRLRRPRRRRAAGHASGSATRRASSTERQSERDGSGEEPPADPKASSSAVVHPRGSGRETVWRGACSGSSRTQADDLTADVRVARAAADQ